MAVDIDDDGGEEADELREVLLSLFVVEDVDDGVGEEE